MDAEEIEEWSGRYDETYPQRLQAIEEELRSALREQGYLTRDQLEKVIDWKLDGQGGRGDGYIDDMRRVPNEFVEKVTESALLVDDPQVQVDTITSIPGVGAATATVVLMFYDPEVYAVGDRYLKHEFLDIDRSMRVTEYPKILDELRDRNPGDYDLRTVEKAYWMRYTVENSVGDWGNQQTT